MGFLNLPEKNVTKEDFHSFKNVYKGIQVYITDYLYKQYAIRMPLLGGCTRLLEG